MQEQTSSLPPSPQNAVGTLCASPGVSGSWFERRRFRPQPSTRFGLPRTRRFETSCACARAHAHMRGLAWCLTGGQRFRLAAAHCGAVRNPVVTPKHGQSLCSAFRIALHPVHRGGYRLPAAEGFTVVGSERWGQQTGYWLHVPGGERRGVLPLAFALERREPHCKNRFGCMLGPLSSCHGPWTALNRSGRSDRVTRIGL